MPDLSRFFSPRSIAIIGASPDATKVRGRIMALLLEGGFGAIYPVNPSHKEVMGRQAYATIADIPEPFDLALVAITAENVPAALKDIAASGCRQAVIYSAGFAEAGGAEAAAREAELSRGSRHHAARAKRRRVLQCRGPHSGNFQPRHSRCWRAACPGWARQKGRHRLAKWQAWLFHLSTRRRARHCRQPRGEHRQRGRHRRAGRN